MKIGLVLSGGMAKGAYQIGALKALRNFIPPDKIEYMSCASVGVLNGYAYATDRIDKIEAMWETLCGNVAKLTIGQLLKSELLQDDINNLFAPDKPVLNPFFCSLLDFDNRNLIYKDLSKVKNELIPSYLKASVAMPIYNKPVTIESTPYFDGAMIDNIPVFPLINKDLDYIICVYFDDVCYKFENTDFDNKIIKISFPAIGKFRQSVVFKKDSIDYMMKDGFERTSKLLNSVFACGYDDTEYIYKEIEKLNATVGDNSLRVTGDVLVTNLNKITQRLMRKKILG